MKNINEFKVNNFITLRLEEGECNIYINGQLFNQCKYILANRKIDDMKDILEIKSIDELAKHLDQSLETIKPELIDISPETQFWVHCSNMQVWAENNYDTRLLHSNLAFPLLERLTELNDPIATKVFKEEIVKRFSSGEKSVVIYLLEEKYHQYLDNEELEFIYLENNTEFRNTIENIISDSSVKISDLFEVLPTLTKNKDILRKMYRKGIEKRFLFSGKNPLKNESLNISVNVDFSKEDQDNFYDKFLYFGDFRINSILGAHLLHAIVRIIQNESFIFSEKDSSFNTIKEIIFRSLNLKILDEKNSIEGAIINYINIIKKNCFYLPIDCIIEMLHILREEKIKFWEYVLDEYQKRKKEYDERIFEQRKRYKEEELKMLKDLKEKMREKNNPFISKVD